MSTVVDSSNAVMAANFLSGTILICLSILAIAGTLIILNNLFVKYWKPIRVFTIVPVAGDQFDDNSTPDRPQDKPSIKPELAHRTEPKLHQNH